MERKVVVYITLTAVLAIVITALCLVFVIPFLRDGEPPLFFALPVSGESAVPGSDLLPQQPEAAAVEESADEAVQSAAAEKEASENALRYEEALSLLCRRDFDRASEAFAVLGDYADSARMAGFALRYPAMEPEFGAPMIDDRYLKKAFENGKVYSLTDYGEYNGNVFKYKGVVYIPDVVDLDTAFVQYFSGGNAGEDYLWYYGVYEYFDEYSPNAVVMFTSDSSCTYIQQRIAFQWDILSQIAQECGTIVHNVSSIASSQGAYTAMQLAYDFYVDYDIPVARCVTLDTGCDWSLDYLALTFDQCAVLAEAGTEFYLFEDHNFRNEIWYPAMQNIIYSDLEVHAYVCKCDNHDSISKNAYSLGFFSFCAGEDIEFPACEYCKVELYPEMADLGEFIWPPRPESETRLIYGS